MRCLILSFLSLLFSAMVFSQREFTAIGKITDDSTGLPLAGASVFCQHTTIGTITDSEGSFSLRLPAGGYDLIVSYTGYETHEQRITASSSAGLHIALKAQDKTMSEVVIAGSTADPDGLEKYGVFFMENFIGTTPNSKECVIQNPEALQFFFSKKRNRLKVRGKDPLVINNNALGYIIRYQLDSFTHEYGTDVSLYSGYPFYEEMTGLPEEQAVWQKNRLAAYKGSRLHFMRAWYDSTLKEENFFLEWVDRIHENITTFDIENPYDPFHYTVTEPGNVVINWKDSRLKVAYRGGLPDSSYLIQYQLPLYLRGQITVLDFNDVITIEPNGYFYNQANVINTGYWSWKKMADAVPYNYEPAL